MQNKVFLDTNIALDIMLDARVYSVNTQNFITQIINSGAKLCVSDISLTTIFYIGAERNKQWDKTKNFIQNIVSNDSLWEICYVARQDIENSLNFMHKNSGADFEDLLQYNLALRYGCGSIITNDKDFIKMKLPLIRTSAILENYNP